VARVYLWGDWQRARSTFNGLAFRINTAADAAARVQVQVAAERIKANLNAQAYMHEPLSPETVLKKAREGKDPRTLIEDGTMRDAIEGFHLGSGMYAVGIRDPQIAEIGEAHEYGTSKMPARPIFRVELERIKGELGKAVRSAVARALRIRG
jgi:hypothetical protein